MAASRTPTPALLASVGLRSYRRSPAYSAIGEPGAMLLAFDRARGEAEVGDESYGILMAIEDGSTRSILLGEVAGLEQLEGVGSAAVEPALQDLAEDGWYVTASSTSTTPSVRDTTPAIEWPGECVDLDPPGTKFLVGAIDMTGVADRLVVEVNDVVHEARFVDRAAVLLIRLPESPAGEYVGSKAVVDAAGTVIDGFPVSFSSSIDGWKTVEGV